MINVTRSLVPDAPERVKAVTSNEDAVVISWLPPRRPNGILTKYTVHIRVLDQGQEVKTIKSSLPAQNLHHEATGLKQRESYEAWVTASTKIGQGPRTPVIKLQLSNTGKPNFPRGEEKDFLPPSFSSSSSRYTRSPRNRFPTARFANDRCGERAAGNWANETCNFYEKFPTLRRNETARSWFCIACSTILRWIDFGQREGYTRSMCEREETVGYTRC